MKTQMITILTIVSLCGGCAMTSTTTGQSDKSELTQQTLATAQAFLKAAGSGDGEKLNQLMADDFVWHNEGDSKIPWIGNWQGKEAVFNQFMPAFGAGLQITSWTTDYSFASSDQAVFIGTMSANASAFSSFISPPWELVV